MRKYYISLLFLVPFQVAAQLYVGARYAGMANPSAPLTGPDAVGGNPAGISTIKESVLSISAENEWQSAPILTHAALVVPSALVHVGLSGGIYQAGEEYRELRLAAALGKRFSDRFSAGLRFNYQQQSFLVTEETASGISADLGFQFQVRPNWIWGLELLNPLALGAGAGESRTQVLKLGTLYGFSSQTLIALQAAYTLRGMADLVLGLEYELLPWLHLRGGISVNPFMHSGGLGLAFERLRIDGAARVHPHLGVSPQIGVAYAF